MSKGGESERPDRMALSATASKPNRSRRPPFTAVINAAIVVVVSIVIVLLAILALPDTNYLRATISRYIGNPVAVTSVFALVGYLLFVIKLITTPATRRFFLEFTYEFARSLAGAVGSLVGVGLDVELPQKRLRRYQSRIRQQRLKLRELRAQLSSSERILSSSAEAKIIDLFRQAIGDDIAPKISQGLEAAVDDRASGRMDEAAIGVMDRAVGRLQSASSTVTIRGFVNLVIGILFALGALYVLRESVGLFSPEQLSRITLAEATYLVGIRVSLALVITLIAYFFLSLYRRSLEDAKYYQNEVTQIEAVISAISLSKTLSDPSISAAVVQGLITRGSQIVADAPPKNAETFRERLALKALEKLPDIKT
jgi:hypothetical protein